MIQPTELRIGNIVEHKGQVSFVDTVHIGLVSLTSTGCTVLSPNEIEPVKITGEWLVKLGFSLSEIYLRPKVKLEVWEYNGSHTVEIVREYWDQDNKEVELFIGILHVHQLQNIYHAVSGGQELTVKSTTDAKAVI